MEVAPHRIRNLCVVDVWVKPFWTTIRASPDRQHVAQVVAVRPEKKQAVALDGLYRSIWDSSLVLSETFSPDSNHLAYGARQGPKAYLVLDEHPGLPYDDLLDGTPIFSPDGTKLAYGARDDNSWKVIVNQQEIATYDHLMGWSFIFSGDSRHFGYHAWRGENCLVVVDSKEFGPYEGLAGFAILPQPQIVGEPKYQQPIQRRTGLNMFSSDGQHFVYVAMVGGNWFVVKDGAKGKHYDEIIPDTLSFFPHTDTIVYAAVKNGQYLIVVNGDDIEIGGKIHPCSIAVSPVSGEFAYVVWTLKGACVVRGTSTYQAYGGVSLGSLTFSPDGNHLAYIDDGGVCVVIDGVRTQNYITISREPLVFSEDSRHLAFVAEKGAGRCFVVLDGHMEIGPFNSIVPDGGPIFVTPKLLRWVAIKEGYAVTMEYEL